MKDATPATAASLFVQVGENDFSLGTSASELAFQLLALASSLKGRYQTGLVKAEILQQKQKTLG